MNFRFVALFKINNRQIFPNNKFTSRCTFTKFLFFLTFQWKIFKYFDKISRNIRGQFPTKLVRELFICNARRARVSASRQAGKTLLEDVETPHTSIIVHRRCFPALRLLLIHTSVDLLGHFGRSTCTCSRWKRRARRPWNGADYLACEHSPTFSTSALLTLSFRVSWIFFNRSQCSFIFFFFL